MSPAIVSQSSLALQVSSIVNRISSIFLDFPFWAPFTFSPMYIIEECRSLVKFSCSFKILSLSCTILSSLFKLPSSMTRFSRLSILLRVKLHTKHSIVGLVLLLVKIAAITVDIFIIFTKGSTEWISSTNTSLKLTGTTFFPGSHWNQAKTACWGAQFLWSFVCLHLLSNSMLFQGSTTMTIASNYSYFEACWQEQSAEAGTCFSMQGSGCWFLHATSTGIRWFYLSQEWQQFS